ncbi:VWA domain-containing protein [Xanthobacter dioxanivorans]|uniref:VWA domain-containing protein n=1 Tax=Xanthobacter dioxanivorans TaxID=2528964 RepID=A0A974PU36_9HYPH|nr:vWA domain-containing protein [Xanthobacter dioxanivorans]QRG09823.1 VWA domain-containing protein [Xanthobacter dioxanivorans]
MPVPRRRLPDPRTLGLAAAFVLAVAALLAPRLPTRGTAWHLLAIVDVTGSMNVRDYSRDGRPVSRLDTVKRTLRDMASRLPCGSRLGLGIFTERRSFLLFEPVEVCADFAPLDGAIAALDWRMAWEGDSYVASGLYSAIALAAPLGAELLFFTDGQEAPPLPASGAPRFDGEAGAVRGLLVGVGGTTPAPIPKFDRDGRETGFYAMTDVPQENRHGLPPAGSEVREGWHPRNAPWGANEPSGEEHLSAVRTSHLEALAAATGLTYVPLADAAALAAGVESAARPHPVPGVMDSAPVPAGLALLVLCGLFTSQALAARRFRSTEKRTAP